MTTVLSNLILETVRWQPHRPGDNGTVNLLPTLIAVGLLVAVTTGLLLARRIPRPWDPLWAIARAILQLALLTFILSGIISDARWVALALTVMFGAAVYTVGRRIAQSRRDIVLIAGALAAGIAVPMLVVFPTGAVAFSGRYLLALGGIVIGGAMSVATLTGRHFREALVSRRDEVEAWLSLGATTRQSVRDLGTRAVFNALVPTTDQTRTTGLVALPGAFVGSIFGGASVLEAGVFQVIVLTSILAAGIITALLLSSGLGASVSVLPTTLDI